ncbi:hypothetical protein AVEN_6543-1 [Araneus ventricosus]|uniref:Uncharacterized protein n=1 Tax=Araneus ventricosus TaxID=182803 RepID=A0A4Y2SG27_ARAVE|nr:hypothetical protein AVEN_6543-1 [Araneus ventricosus]
MQAVVGRNVDPISHSISKRSPPSPKEGMHARIRYIIIKYGNFNAPGVTPSLDMRGLRLSFKISSTLQKLRYGLVDGCRDRIVRHCGPCIAPITSGDNPPPLPGYDLSGWAPEATLLLSYLEARPATYTAAFSQELAVPPHRSHRDPVRWTRRTLELASPLKIPHHTKAEKIDHDAGLTRTTPTNTERITLSSGFEPGTSALKSRSTPEGPTRNVEEKVIWLPSSYS